MAITNLNLSSLNGKNGFRVEGVVRGIDLGSSVSNAGDVNGDGFDDVIIGAKAERVAYAPPYSGNSYVVFGKGSGFNPVVNLSNLNGSDGFRLDAAVPGDYFGASASNAGDVNGDGFDDVIIGAPGVNLSPSSSYVVFGKGSGFSAALDVSSLDGNNGFRLDGAGGSVSTAGDVNGDGFDDLIVGAYDVSYVVFGQAAGFDAAMNVSSLDGSNGFRLDGEVTYDWVISNAGDMNGDGFADVMVGVRSADPNGRNSGSSYVVFGKVSGFDATLNLSSLDGSNGFRLDGGSAYDYSGSSVSTAGDVNGDGFDDVIVGAYSGSSYVIFGKASGFNATLSLSSLDGSNGFRLDGAGGSVSTAGDVNGDGFDDVIVGVPDADPNGYSYSGSSYVVFGKASGFDATMKLSSLDSNSGVRLDGAGEHDRSGEEVSSAGDVNGDGFDDLMVTAPGAGVYPAAASVGSYIIFGSRQFTGTVTYSGTPGDDILTGTSAIEIFNAGEGNDLMIGGGGADVFRGGFGDDVIRVPDAGFLSVDGGAGNDTVELAGGGIDLNLADVNQTIEGIETINLTGSGDNTLTLTAQDVFDLSDTTNTLVVKGNAGDRVAGLSQGWADGGMQGNFNVYTQRGAVLLVDAAISTDPLSPGVISLSNLNGNDGFRLDAGYSFRSESSISDAGDVNGDGFDDVIVGVPFAYTNDGPTGSSYVVFGKASGFAAAMDLSNLDGSNGFRLDGEAVLDAPGWSVSSAGDVNDDGFDDVIIGAIEPNGDRSGFSYVVFGKTSGFSATLNLSSLDGANGFRLDGAAEDDLLGWSVSNAGDVNGDDFDDVIIGAFTADPNGDISGSSYVVFGKTSGFDAILDLSSLDGSNGFRLDGVAAGDQSGWSVSSAGDINGDGFADVIIGAPGAEPNGDSSGASYVVFGKASGFGASLNLSSLDGSNGFRLDGAGGSVSTAGDVNGDGIDDAIVGAPFADPNGDSSGASYVVFGRASGFEAALNLSSLDGSNGFRVDGEMEYDLSGSSVSSAGDVNGDGFDDLMIGSGRYQGISGSAYVMFGRASGFDATLNLASLNGSNGIRLDGGNLVSNAGDVNGDGFDDLMVGAEPRGSFGYGPSPSYVLFGRSSFDASGEVIQGTPGNDKLTGTLAAEIFEAGDGDDRMIGGGGADVFHGDAGDDYIQVTDLGFGLVDGGVGNDVLHTDGKDLNLDLANFNDKIHGIETICLYGRGDNTLTLTAADLLNLSDTDNTLRVNGNAGDHVTVLDDGWVDEGNRGQGYFHVYTNEDAVLLVGMNVTIDFV